MKILLQESKLKRHETKKIIRVIYRSFCKFNFGDAGQEHIAKVERLYGKQRNISKARKQLQKSEILITAKIDNKICWVIRGRKEYIRSLYVIEWFHKFGIGSKLLLAFEKKTKQLWGKKIRLKSSPYAENFYKKRWFVQQGIMLEKQL